MKKSTIWILGIVMGLSFLSLLYLQVSYIEEMVKMRREQFDESVRRSLDQACRNIELVETKKYLEDDVVATERAAQLYRQQAAHRDHRKIAVIDGKVAYTGGMNIADYYINGLPKIGTWRDMHMRIEGDAVNDLQEIFLTIWSKQPGHCRKS